MEIEAIRKKIVGPIAYPTTPFSESNTREIDEETFRKQISFLVNRGIKVVVPCGGTGEFFSLDIQEWHKLVSVALDQVSREEILIIPAVGGGINHAIKMANLAEQLGCHMIQITFLDPMFGATEEGIYEYNRLVSESVSIPVMLYRTPRFPTSIEMAKRMCREIANVAAFKDEVGDLEWFTAFAHEQGDSVVLVSGTSESMLPYYILGGAKAFTSGIANLVPHISIELYLSVINRNWDKVLSIQNILRPLDNLRRRPGRMIPVIKEGLRIIGIANNAESRPPVLPLCDAERIELRNILTKLGVSLV
jgi:4-hydroxy-tetrahydrodipicolinate synthase